MSLGFRVSTVALAFLLPALLFAQTNDEFIVSQLVGVDDPPTTPTNVLATPIAPTQIDVSWTASTDDLAVSGYEIFRDSIFHATVTAPTVFYNDTGLTPSTTYSYEVRAFDSSSFYSPFGTSSATTTPNVVVSTTTATTTSSGPIYGTYIGDIEVSAHAFLHHINLRIVGSRPVKAVVQYGTSYDGELGTISLPVYREQHDTVLAGLTPNTLYRIVVLAVDAQGKTYKKTIMVRTARSVESRPIPNPSGFKAVAVASGIRLTWQNPDDANFEEVRVMRHEGTLPIDPYDGVAVYEGAREGFFDNDVNDGAIYGYTIFAKDRFGNYSSGAVVMVRAYSIDTVGDSALIVTPGESSGFRDRITIKQNDVFHRVLNGRIEIKNDAPFLISIPTETFPRVLKTIVVTLTHPERKKETFSFLLRANGDKSAYEAMIDSLKDRGTYDVDVSVLNLTSKSILSDQFALDVTSEGDYREGNTGERLGDFAPVMRLLLFPFILFLLLAYGVHRMILLGRQKR